VLLVRMRVVMLLGCCRCRAGVGGVIADGTLCACDSNLCGWKVCRTQMLHTVVAAGAILHVCRFVCSNIIGSNAASSAGLWCLLGRAAMLCMQD
jgi:hypothetical protein